LLRQNVQTDVCFAGYLIFSTVATACRPNREVTQRYETSRCSLIVSKGNGLA
jgi:hypothetical protein